MVNSSIFNTWKKYLQEQQNECEENLSCGCVDSSTSIELKDVQNFLAKKYGKEEMTITFKSGAADGLCGPETRGMIMKFQKESKIKCDACIGPETLGFLEKDPIWSEVTTKTKKPTQKVIKITKSKKIDGAETINKKNDSRFPIVNGKQFVLPIEGVKDKTYGAGFHQKRGRGIHASIDQFVDEGTVIQAVSDGVVVSVSYPGSTYDDGPISGLAKIVNQRKKEGKLSDDFSQAYGHTINILNNRKDKTGWSKKMATMKTNSLASVLEKVETLPDAPGNWIDMRKWAKKNLDRDAMANLVRYYKRKGIYRNFPLGGREITLKTSPDQEGNQFLILYSHLSAQEVNVGDKVISGQTIGKVGNTGVFDSKTHLHFAIFNPKFGETERNQVNPNRIIPNLTGVSAGIYPLGDV